MKEVIKTTDTCRKVDPNYKDKCQRLPILGCEGCWYHGYRIVSEIAKTGGA